MFNRQNAQSTRAKKSRLGKWLLFFVVLAIAGAFLKLRQVSDWLKEKMQSCQKAAPPAAPQKTAVVTMETPPLSPDNLQRIKGIGPKIARLLNEHNIYTFEQLSAADADALADLLRQRGWQMVNPSAWPEQAQKFKG